MSPQESLLTITGSGTINTTFAVDANTARVQIDLTSTRALSTSTSNSLYLVDPNGVSITPLLNTSSTYFRLYSIKNPTPGFWKLLSNQPYSHTIQITIPDISNTSATVACSTTLSRKIMRESDNAYGPLLTAPIVNQSDLVLVTLYHNLPSSIQSTTIELVNKLGETISLVKTTNVTKTGSIISSLIIPDADFRILTKVKLTDGSIVQRQSNVLISPTSISISIINQPYTLTNNSITSITFKIFNRAQETLLIRMCAIDTLKLLGMNGTCREYTVTNMNFIDDILNVTIDAWSKENNTIDVSNMTGGSITFDIAATSSAGKKLKNYNKIPFYIQTQEYNPMATTTTIITLSSKATFYYTVCTHSYGFSLIFLFSLMLSYYRLY